MSAMQSQQQSGKGRLGILVGGGPAPGINGVIGAATIEANNKGLEVVGIYDGFRSLCRGETSNTKVLTTREVSRIHFKGGSILRTSRENPNKAPETMQNVVNAIRELGLKYLVTIGGDDTASSAGKVADAMGNELRVAHVPKTIDNDLTLPGNMPTFGFQTARHVGVGLVSNLMEDALTTSRWYLVVCMGRKAGHLALGIGKSAGATISLIAEEFQRDRIALSDICDVLEGAILKRRAMGQKHGVAVIAEGLAEHFDPEELKSFPGVNVSYDDHGHLELREVPLSQVLKREVERRLAACGEKVTVVDVNLGYELRCADPIPFDCEYVRDLGWGAVTYLLSSDYAGGAMVSLDGGRLRPLLFTEVIDPVTQHAKVRLVDVHSEYFEVAVEYMIRLRPEDFEDEEQLARLAEAAHVTPEQFAEQFASVRNAPIWKRG